MKGWVYSVRYSLIQGLKPCARTSLLLLVEPCFQGWDSPGRLHSTHISRQKRDVHVLTAGNLGTDDLTWQRGLCRSDLVKDLERADCPGLSRGSCNHKGPYQETRSQRERWLQTEMGAMPLPEGAASRRRWQPRGGARKGNSWICLQNHREERGRDTSVLAQRDRLQTSGFQSRQITSRCCSNACRPWFQV